MEKDTTLLWTRRYPMKPTVFRNPHRAWSDPHETRWQVRYRYEVPQSFPTWEEAYGYAFIAAVAMIDAMNIKAWETSSDDPN